MPNDHDTQKMLLDSLISACAPSQAESSANAQEEAQADSDKTFKLLEAYSDDSHQLYPCAVQLLDDLAELQGDYARVKGALGDQAVYIQELKAKLERLSDFNEELNVLDTERDSLKAKIEFIKAALDEKQTGPLSEKHLRKQIGYILEEINLPQRQPDAPGHAKENV